MTTRKAPERSQKLRRLLDDPDIDFDDDKDVPVATSSSSSTPAWERAFDQYIYGDDDVPDGMSLVEWWGVRIILLAIHHTRA